MTDAALKKIRQAVVDAPWFLVYDNINFASRRSDQRIDNSDSFESGTTATVVMMDDMIASDDVRLSYQRLCPSDLIPGEDSYAHMQAVSEHALVEVLARSSENYNYCRKSTPTRHPLATVKTVTHPLPSMHIDQASVAGNLEVLNTIMEKSLRLPQTWFDAERKILVAGDQLTISRISKAMEYKAVDISPFHRLQFAIPWLQLFHLEMAFCGLILQTHWGSTNQIGSLQFNKVFLKRKRVSLTDFDFHAADELLRHTFDAMVKRIWEVYLQNVDLAKAIEGMSANQVQDLVAEKVTDIVNDLISPDPDELSGYSRTNRNMALLLRHLLFYFELRTAIKAGDIGRIEESLKWITVMFQNGTNNNYGLELLRVHCAIRYAWTPEMKRRIMATWLVNTKGKENGWIPTDMYQEHNNNLMKAVFNLKGSNSTWNTRESSISVNIRTFGTIRKQFDECFNRTHNSTFHSTVSAEEDINQLMSKYRQNNILGEDRSAGDPDLEITLDNDLFACGLAFLIESRIDSFKKTGTSDDDEDEEEDILEDPFQ